MERFVKNFIVMSILYFAIAAVMGVAMLASPSLVYLKFAHSHLNMLGWVSMMIYGVGYHILPRFAGKRLKSVRMGEVQFYLSNIGLAGLLVFYSLYANNTDETIFRSLSIVSGCVEVISIFLFFYNMITTLLAKDE